MDRFNSIGKRFVLLTVLIIIVSFTVSTMFATMAVQSMSKKYARELVKAQSAEIQTNIERELSRAVTVADSLDSLEILKSFLREEKDMSATEAGDMVKGYLTYLKEDYSLSSVYLLVDSNLHCYSENGVIKSAGKAYTDRVNWYRTFQAQQKETGLDVSQDYDNSDIWNIYVNRKIFDDNGDLLGVCRLGIDSGAIVKILDEFESNSSSTACIVNSLGQVKLASTAKDKGLDQIDVPATEEGVETVVSEKAHGYLIVRRILSLDWYLTVESKASYGDNSFQKIVRNMLIVMAVILILLLLIVVEMIVKNGMKVERKATLKGMGGLSSIYSTMHLIDLKADTYEEITSNNAVALAMEGRRSMRASELIKYLFIQLTDEKFIDDMLKFVDLSTIDERLSSSVSNNISQEFLGKVHGWCRARFIGGDRDESGRYLNALFCMEIIDNEKRRENQLMYLSQTDLMTDLRNRGSGEKKISELMSYGKAGTLFILDINSFKVFNDSFGHSVGDKVIIEVANSLKRSFRDQDIIMRLGGDEFAVYTVGLCDDDELNAITERFFKEIEAIDIPEIGILKVTVSVGITVFEPESGYDFDRLYRCADNALYLAKKRKAEGNVWERLQR